MSRGVAFFDFDGTLIEGDSLWLFVTSLLGPKKVSLVLAKTVGKALLLWIVRKNKEDDFRTFFKRQFLHTSLAGVSLASAKTAAQFLAEKVRWKNTQLDALRSHQKQGHTVVIATGALDLYMPSLLAAASINADGLLMTTMEVQQGVLTGHIIGGNCVRVEKAARVQAYLDQNGPFSDTWGYGNRPSDIPMLNLLNHQTII